MKIFNQKTAAVALSIVIFTVPMLALAQAQQGILSGICPQAPNCTFDDLIKLANSIIKFLLYGVAVPLTAIGFMVQGARMILSGDKAGARSTAKEGLKDILTGFAIMLGAYVLIKVILFAFLTESQKSFMQFIIK